MAENHPFVLAASKGALDNLESSPYLKAALKNGVFKDIWGSTYTDFMGIQGTSGGDLIGDSPSDYNRAFTGESIVFTCIDIRAAAIASVPIYVWDSTDPNKRKRVDHDALDVIRRTNPISGFPIKGSALWKYTVASRDLHGKVAWQLVLDNKGLPREIYWLAPQSYKVVFDPKTIYGGLKVRQNNREVFVPPEQTFYAPTMNPQDYLNGMSKITALKDAINLRQKGVQSNLWWFQNNQRPDVIVTGAFAPTTENVTLLRRIWKQAFQSDGNRGPAFLPSDVKVNLLTPHGKDLEWLGQQNFSREEMLAVFKVPPPVYGDLSRATYENIRSAYQHFWQEGMIPEMDELAEKLTIDFLWRWPDAAKAGLVFGFDYTQIEALQEDRNAIWERFMALRAAVAKEVELRVTTPNQARKVLKYEAKRLGMLGGPYKGKVDRGNTFMLPYNHIPVMEAGVQAIIDQAASRAGNTDGKRHNAGNGTWQMPDPPLPSPACPTCGGPNMQNGQCPDCGSDRQQDRQDRLAAAAQAPALPPALPQPAPKKPGKAFKAKLPHDKIREARLASTQDWARRKFQRYFQDQQTEALRNLRIADKAAEAQAEETKAAAPDPDSLWDRDNAREQARTLARQIIAMAASVAVQSANEDYGLSVEWDMENPWVDQFMGSRLHLIQNIDDTTRSDIRSTLLEGAESGESMTQLGQRVSEVFRGAIDNRAQTIARTETVQAYSKASLFAYGQAGVQKAEMYDGDFDEECAALNGQIVTLDEAESLMNDEHPNGTRGVAPFVEPIDDGEGE